jgi:hypothetical protein
MTQTYRIEHRQGWAANTHFGHEIQVRIEAAGNEFATLAEARSALNRHRRDHGGRQSGRFDIVGGNCRWSWQ